MQSENNQGCPVFYRFFILLLLMQASAAMAATNTMTHSTTRGAFIGGESCRSCHQAEFKAWQGSHHDLAMQLPTADTVLGDFNKAKFQYNGITTTFFQRDGRYFVHTDGEDGTLQDFPVSYVFGVYPLQQYLLPLDRGRLQALSIAWDSRPQAEGGQRWFHLYPDDVIDYKDPLHWTGPYQNWNTRCAECHSTDLQKNYHATKRSFSTVFSEVNVSCEACHGPGEKHRQLALTDKLKSVSNGGFDVLLAQRGQWHFSEGASIARRMSPLDNNSQIDTCGRCHARRGTLGSYHPGRPLTDTHRLALPQEPLYYPDGQIRDEVYVYGSFIQSKMHQAGVVCSNCHEPHSLQLRAEGNGVCAQCHQPATYDSPKHHHHNANSSGARCANCHMPETTYMVVDPRRDHSMRIPRPDLSLTTGSPNACTGCHTDQNSEWALAALNNWGVHFSDSASHPARAFTAAANGDNRALPRLAELAADGTAAPIWRATAMNALGQQASQDALQLAAKLLQSDEPLLRISAIGSLDWLPIARRYLMLRPFINDDNTSVRMAVAESLAEMPLEQLPQAATDNLVGLFHEYQNIAREHADMPGSQMQLGVFLSARGDLPGAERAYREALTLNSQLIAAHLNLADLLRAQQRDDEARQLLQTALAIAPDNGNVLHALGLLEMRGGDRTKALDYLQQAAQLEQAGSRHRYVYAIALHDLGQPQEALQQLDALRRQLPHNPEILMALINYYEETGNYHKALAHLDTLMKLQPKNPNLRPLQQRLQAATSQQRPIGPLRLNK